MTNPKDTVDAAPVAWITPEALSDIINDRPWVSGAVGEFRADGHHEGFTVPLYAPDALAAAKEAGIRAALKLVEDYTRVTPAFVTEDEGGQKWEQPARLAPIWQPEKLVDAILALLSHPAPDADTTQMPSVSGALSQKTGDLITTSCQGILDHCTPAPDAEDDITPEAIAKVRDKAGPIPADLELISGWRNPAPNASPPGITSLTTLTTRPPTTRGGAGELGNLFNDPPDAKERDRRLAELVVKAQARFDALTPEQQEAERQAQRESWVRGQIAMGNDRQEAEARAVAFTKDNADAGGER